jgi:hypothetical protein
MEFILNEEKINVDIYADDTIEMGCYKLSQVLKCSINDIYMFSKHEKTLTASQVFNIVSYPFETIPNFHLHNFLENLNQHIPPLTEEYYTESDLKDYYDVLIDFPIGQTMIASVNPKNVHHLEKYKNLSCTPQFQTLFLDYMPFFENKIYVCLKRDFAGYDLYFNHDLNASSMESKNKSITELYLLPDPPIVEEGIQRVVCRIDPIEPIIVPLDIIFNLLHTTVEMPMIQYNTGNDDTILYKLFSVNEDIKGNKIPVLPMSTVTKHDQSYKNSVTVIFDSVKIAFMNNGSIILETVGGTSSIEQIDTKLKQYTKVIEQVGAFMYESGYTYPTFTSIRNGTLLDLVFMMNFKTTHAKKDGCNYFFIDIGNDIKRYRRVSNFNESTLVYELCVNGIGKESIESIGKKIAAIFHVNQKQAEKKVAEFYSTIDTTKKHKIKEKTGFSTLVKKTHTNFTVTMSDIKSLYYLEPIRKNMCVYVSSLGSKQIVCESNINSIELDAIDYDRYSSSDSDSDESLDIVDESDTESLDIVDESDQEGGARDDPDLIIKNPSFLITRIQTYFPNPDKEYSRKCPRDKRPVALSPEEAKHEYVKKIPDNKKLVHNGATFICPMYWDMEHKVPLTADQLKDKKVIPNVKIDKLDFNEHGTVHKMNDGSTPYPGLLDNNMGPCCYKKPQTNAIPKVVAHESKQHINNHPYNLNEYGRVSYIPDPLRYFFGLPSNCSFEDGKYLLRYGVNKPHSFMDCIEACSNIIFSKKLSRDGLFKKIGEMATKGFYTYNNGNLPRQFKTVKRFIELIPEMDYTYLWEIISEFFSCNLVIFRTPSITELEIVCPSNHYISTPFLPNRSTIMILEQYRGIEENIKDFLKRTTPPRACFEPLIEHNIKENTHNLLHVYKHLQKSFEKLITIYESCSSISEHYTTNVVAQTMYAKLKHTDIKQVTKNQKCIGFSVKNVFIPCHPSAILSATVVPMPVNTYDATEKVLREFSKLVPCKPLFKVVENDEITGIITETNSFVPCIVDDDHKTTLPVYTSKVVHEYDTVVSTKDVDRITYVNRSKVEKYMYASLRRLLKELASKNYDMRKKLKDLSKTKEVTETIIHAMLKDHVSVVSSMNDDFIKAQLKCKGNCFANGKLITKQSYFAKLSTELNHYPRIATFITSSQLLIPTTSFLLNDNELLLMGSMVESYYDELMEPKRLTDHYTTYDNANPAIVSSLTFKVDKLEFIII